MIDLTQIKPTTISKDLKGKYLLIYGLPKVGKTTFAVQAPRNLLLALERGYNAIANANAVDITKWIEIKQYLKQLEKPEVKDMFDTISIDTVGQMWDLCEQYVCAQNNVDNILDIPYGKGYVMAKKEFEGTLRKITMLGYGLILISHVDTKTEKTSDGTEIDIIGPALNKRAYAIVNQLVDIIGYIDYKVDADGNATRTLLTRKTPTVMAGSRFAHLENKIPFGYKELCGAISNAIDMSGKIDGAVISDEVFAPNKIEKTFEEIQEEGRMLWGDLVETNPDNYEKVMTIIENIFGQRLRLSEITPRQKDLFEEVINQMSQLK